MLSLTELRRAASILERDVVGHRIQGVAQRGPHAIVLTLYGRVDDEGRRRHLVLSASPETARVSLAPTAAKSGGPPPGFTQYLRAHLEGGRIGSIRLLGEDRQLALRVRTSERDFDLLLAIFGRRSNLYVLDSDGNVVVTLRPPAETRPELAIGEPWQPPGTPPRTAGEDRFAAEPDASFLEAIESAYADREEDSARDALARRIEQALRKETRSLDRKLVKLDAELAAAEAATELERHGELLKSVLRDVKRGDREVVVKDWESGEDVRVALDPLLEPAANLERLFKRYRKAIRALTKGGAQRSGVQESRDEMAALESEYARVATDDESALAAFAERKDMARLLAKYAPAEPAKQGRPGKPREVKLAGREVPAKFVPRRYRTESGLEVWVGRSDASNDYLSVRLARGKDLFFHLDGAPGSHVILRTEGREDPPSEAVLDACELAVHFSKQKNATRADVHIVPIKNVRKPKGAKPGLVMVHGGRSLHLRRVPSRLERILAARVLD